MGRAPMAWRLSVTLAVSAARGHPSAEGTASPGGRRRHRIAFGRMPTIVTLPGDGIGPEILPCATAVLDAVAPGRFTYTEHPFGGAAIDATGEPLPAACLLYTSDAADE